MTAHGQKTANIDYEQYVTDLTTVTPFDGQEVFYAADATNGIIWHLRYRTAVSRWEFVGGPPIVATYVGNIAASSLDIQANIPLKGKYVLDWGFRMQATAPGTIEERMVVTKTDGSTWLTWDGAWAAVVGQSSDYPRITAAALEVVTVTGAGTHHGKCDYGTNPSIMAAWMRFTPQYVTAS